MSEGFAKFLAPRCILDLETFFIAFASELDTSERARCRWCLIEFGCNFDFITTTIFSSVRSNNSINDSTISGV